MKVDQLPTYNEVIHYLEKKKRPKHLLLGNGFSMAFDSGIFSYNALSTFIERSDNELLQKLFNAINTKNFEQIMQQLDSFCKIAEIFSTDKTLVNKISSASNTLKENLIDAVKELHPEHVFTVSEEKSTKCALFLEEYLTKGGKIFSTNYDLLLYWVLMRNNISNAVDGFGRELENTDAYKKEEDPIYSELRWGKYKNEQTVYYLHGALPIFDSGIEIIKEEYDSQHFLLEKIRTRMEKRDYPIFVTAGNASEKLNHIMHNKYLSFCYEDFSLIQGSLITFGFNFGDYDTHIIEAINKASNHGMPSGEKLLSIYIGVYSDKDIEHIERIKGKFKCKVNLYNARTANIWN
jgi:hypothetical protein